MYTIFKTMGTGTGTRTSKKTHAHTRAHTRAFPKVYVCKRPGVDEFLLRAGDHFEVLFWVAVCVVAGWLQICDDESGRLSACVHGRDET